MCTIRFSSLAGMPLPWMQVRLLMQTPKRQTLSPPPDAEPLDCSYCWSKNRKMNLHTVSTMSVGAQKLINDQQAKLKRQSVSRREYQVL